MRLLVLALVLAALAGCGLIDQDFPVSLKLADGGCSAVSPLDGGCQ